MSETGSSQEKTSLLGSILKRVRGTRLSQLTPADPSPQENLEKIDPRINLAHAAFAKLALEEGVTLRLDVEYHADEERFIVLDSQDSTTHIAIALRWPDWSGSSPMMQENRRADLLRITYWKNTDDHGTVDIKNFDGRRPWPPGAEKKPFESHAAESWENPEQKEDWLKRCGVFMTTAHTSSTPEMTDPQIQKLTELISGGVFNKDLTDKARAFYLGPGFNMILVVDHHPTLPQLIP